MDNALDYERFPIEILLPNLDIGEAVDWSLCPNQLDARRRRATSPRPSNADFNRNLRHPFFWLDAAVHYQFEVNEDVQPNPPATPALSPLQGVVLHFERVFQRRVDSGDWRAIFPMLAALEAVLTRVGTGEHGTGWRAYEGQLISWFNHVDSLKPESSNDRDALFIWFWLAARCFSEQYGATGGVLEQPVADRLVRAALWQLGMLRTEVRILGKEWDWDFYTEALQVAVAFGGLWQSIKQLLLVLRELPEPAVASDLRYWPEPRKEQCPLAFGPILMWIANLLGNPQVRREREQDPELRSLRAEFSAFCLKRLKTKEAIDPKPLKAPSNEDFYEPNPIWRACFARAAGELRINPRGTSHHIAWWSAQNDPDETVRECSRQLYDTLRHQTPLDPGLSPRRPLLAAFWWLRQAHLKSLGLEIDERGAQRTRSKELRRTVELHKVWKKEVNLSEAEKVTM